jgi:general nucleoside transport system permease protein
VSEPLAPGAHDPEETAPGTVAARLAFYQSAGGVITPLLTTLFAFFIGGLVVLLTTGQNPLSTYKAIFEGTGLNWFGQVGSYDIGLPFSDARVWFPWNVNEVESLAATNLQQTLLLTVPLILTGLAVAFAFRCGMFNIGGQGQYIVGWVTALLVGVYVTGLPALAHVALAVAVAALAAAAWAAIAGVLKATVGAHEVIATIMLNWIAIYVAIYLFEIGGPLQDPTQVGVPTSEPIEDSAKVPVFWGDPLFQGLHVGFFLALAALVAYWIVLNRTTLGYEVRAVGFNPEAARYGGINVARSYVLAMAISGLFAGVAGSLDLLGWQFRIATPDVQVSSVGYIGIAVALLGRNTAVGVFFSSILFAALLNGTSTRNLDPDVFRPELASNLTLVIQGLVVLFVGADVFVLYLWQARRKLGLVRRKEAVTT